MIPEKCTERLPTALLGLNDFVLAVAKVTSSLFHRWASDPPVGFDQLVEDEILKEVSRFFPKCSVLSEEHFRKHGTLIRPGHSLQLLIDPIDGSDAYKAGKDTFTTSVACEIDGNPVVSFVIEHRSGTVYSALRHCGAFVNGTRIPSNQQPKANSVCIRSSLLEGPHGRRLRNSLERLGMCVEPLQCTSLKMCWTALGERLAVIKRVSTSNGKSMRWGIAAANLFCREAGIKCVAFDGELYDADSSSIVAVNSSSRAAILEALKVVFRTTDGGGKPMPLDGG